MAMWRLTKKAPNQKAKITWSGYMRQLFLVEKTLRLVDMGSNVVMILWWVFPLVSVYINHLKSGYFSFYG